MQLDLFATGTLPQTPDDARARRPGLDRAALPGRLAEFQLVHVANGRAMIEDDAGLWIVQRGSTLPDNSQRRQSIEQRDGKWVHGHQRPTSVIELAELAPRPQPRDPRKARARLAPSLRQSARRIPMEPVNLFDLAAKQAQWLAVRQSAIAGNIANANTPGYRAVDVEPFEKVLDQTGVSLTATQAGHLGGDATEAGFAIKPRGRRPARSCRRRTPWCSRTN